MATVLGRLAAAGRSTNRVPAFTERHLGPLRTQREAPRTSDRGNARPLRLAFGSTPLPSTFPPSAPTSLPARRRYHPWAVTYVRAPWCVLRLRFPLSRSLALREILVATLSSCMRRRVARSELVVDVHRYRMRGTNLHRVYVYHA